MIMTFMSVPSILVALPFITSIACRLLWFFSSVYRRRQAPIMSSLLKPESGFVGSKFRDSLKHHTKRGIASLIIVIKQSFWDINQWKLTFNRARGLWLDLPFNRELSFRHGNKKLSFYFIIIRRRYSMSPALVNFCNNMCSRCRNLFYSIATVT